MGRPVQLTTSGLASVADYEESFMLACLLLLEAGYTIVARTRTSRHRYGIRPLGAAGEGRSLGAYSREGAKKTMQEFAWMLFEVSLKDAAYFWEQA